MKASKTNTFKKAVEATPDIAQCYEKGLDAIQEKNIIKMQDTQKLEGSVFIDECLKQVQQYSQQNRWDYVVGYKDHAFYIEVHGAKDDEVKVLIKKLQWVKAWRASSEGLSKIPSTYHWVRTKGSITKRSRWQRIAAEATLYPVKILDLDQVLQEEKETHVNRNRPRTQQY